MWLFVNTEYSNPIWMIVDVKEMDLIVAEFMNGKL
jgi:hypothetical protein